jgi:hypothetical protein
MPEIITGGVWQAAFAMTRGAELLGVVRAKDHKGWVLFRLSNEDGVAEQAIQDWDAGETLADAKELALAHSLTVQMLRNERSNW